MLIKTDIIFENHAWRRRKCSKLRSVKKVILTLMRALNLGDVSISFCILLSDNAKMRALNHKFLNYDSVTNVLSFPSIDLNPQNLSNEIPKGKEFYLGDIAFGYERVAMEAKEHKLRFSAHFNHLLIHSILHLLGHDHDCEQRQEHMYAIEDETLGFLGIKKCIRNAA